MPEMARVEYEKMARLESVHWWYRALHLLVERALGASAPDFRTLLDAGCGTGGLLEHLRPRYPQALLTGLDSSSHAIELSRERGLRLLCRGSMNDAGFRSSVFDVVTSNDVISIAGVDAERTLREIHRVLRTNGIVILNLPAFEFLRSSHDRIVRTARRFRRREVVDLLGQTGFEVLRATYWNVALFPLVAAFRFVRRRDGDVDSDVRPLRPVWNRLLFGILRGEIAWLARGTAPLGSSVFCVGRKQQRAVG